jgi:Tfp pilus assembly protein PilF
MGCYRGGDDPAPAMQLLDRALSTALDDKDRAQAHFFRGMGFRAIEDEERAMAEFKAAVAADPAFPPPHLAMKADQPRTGERPRQAGA